MARRGLVWAKRIFSVFYALLVWEAGISGGSEIFDLAAVIVTASIIAHSSTDLVVVRWFKSQNEIRHQSAGSTGSTNVEGKQAG